MSSLGGGFSGHAEDHSWFPFGVVENGIRYPGVVRTANQQMVRNLLVPQLYIEMKVVRATLKSIDMLVELHWTKALIEDFSLGWQLRRDQVFAKPGSDIFRVWYCGRKSNEPHSCTDRLHAGHDSFKGSPARVFQNVYFIDQEELDKLNQFRVVPPLSSHAVPFLRCCDDDVGLLHFPQMLIVGVSSEFSTVESMEPKLALPVLLSFGTQRLDRSHVHDLEISVMSGCEKAGDCQFHDQSLATTGGCRQDQVIVGLKRGVEAFRLDSVQKLMREDGSYLVRQLICANQLDPTNDRRSFYSWRLWWDWSVYRGVLTVTFSRGKCRLDKRPIGHASHIWLHSTILQSCNGRAGGGAKSGRT